MDNLMLDQVKSRVSATAFRMANIQRIHIIGCARSGTTFFQYCMLAYKQTEVVNSETSPLFPDFRPSLSLCRKAYAGGGLNYVTKRNYGWFLDSGIRELLESVALYRTGVIHIMRDPRAVLRSKHPGSTQPDDPYLDEDRWYRSMTAAETIWEALADYERKCVIRYEDLILRPHLVDQGLSEKFGLVKEDGVRQINLAMSNALRRGYVVSSEQGAAMHGLRDADAASLRTDLVEVSLGSEAARMKYQEILSTCYNSAY